MGEAKKLDVYWKPTHLAGESSRWSVRSNNQDRRVNFENGTDAHAFAATPLMIEALKEILSVRLEVVTDRHVGYTVDTNVYSAIEKAKAALAAMEVPE